MISILNPYSYTILHYDIDCEIVWTNFREQTFATIVNPDGKGPSTYEAFDFDFSDAECKRRAGGYDNNRDENGSSPSTLKQDPELNNWSNDVEQRQQTSGANNITSVERGHGFERSLTYSLILFSSLLTFFNYFTFNSILKLIWLCTMLGG
jgi:hypothetical protein